MGTLTLRTQTLNSFVTPGTLTTRVGCLVVFHRGKVGRRGTLTLRVRSYYDRIPGTLTTRILEGCLVVFHIGEEGGRGRLSHRQERGGRGRLSHRPTCMKELVRGDSHTSHADPKFKKSKG